VATLLNYTAPIFSGVFSMLFIGERFTARVLVALPVAFTGVFLVVQANARPGDVLGFGPWEVVGLFSAIASGAAVTAMRAARRGENSWAVYSSFCFLGALVTGPFAIATWNAPTAREWIFLAATSFFAIGAQLLLTFSLRWVDAMTVGVISQLAVVISMFLGAVFLRDTVTLMAIVGSILTIGGVVGVIYITSTSTPRAAADEVVPEA
jgi:drug/metabolite transporter (DMT)-like permease